MTATGRVGGDRPGDDDDDNVATTTAATATTGLDHGGGGGDDDDHDDHDGGARSPSDEKGRRTRDLVRLESRGYDVGSSSNVPKRRDYLSWDDYFLAVACLSARRSKDPAPRGGGRGTNNGGGGVRRGCVG